jgi:hypothetical protein
MVRCDECQCLVDTDFELESYVEALNVYLCEACLERYEDECRAGNAVDDANDTAWADGRAG